MATKHTRVGQCCIPLPTLPRVHLVIRDALAAHIIVSIYAIAAISTTETAYLLLELLVLFAVVTTTTPTICNRSSQSQDCQTKNLL